MRWTRPLGAAALLIGALGTLRSLRSRRVDDVPFCSIVADGRVGPDWASRRNIEADPVPGEIDEFGVYDRDGCDGRDRFDASRIHPEVRRFYERTADYDLSYETTWHRGFRLGARIAALATSRLEQLNLPGRSNAGVKRLESRIARVSREIGPREDARVWTRTDPDSGASVFVAIYATHERNGVTYANVAVPLPRSNLSTVLRPEPIERGDESDRDGVRFTTRGGGDGGLYLVTSIGGFRLPMDQSFRVWPIDAPGAPLAPTDGSGADADLVASHEMWLFGRQFLTIRYGIARRRS